MMFDFMEELSEYNREIDPSKRIPMSIFGPVKMKNFYDIEELDETTLEEWNHYLRPFKELDREEIIGEVFTERERKIK